MDGDHSGQEPFVGLPLAPAPRLRGRRLSRHRIGPLRTAAEAAGHPVLNGIRSGAVTGLVIVAMLGLPILLILGAKAPAPSVSEPPARVWAAAPEAVTSVRPWGESAGVPPRASATIAPTTTALVEPPRNRGVEDRPVVLSLDLIPVLDDESGALSVEEPSVPVVKPGRPSRISGPPRAARVP